VVLHHGEKIAEGPPQAISRDPRVVDAYLGEEFVLADA
jgi:branched-chain amino acid transport system ATP-binding protein